MDKLIRSIQESDIVITIHYKDGMKVLKNRDGRNDIKIDIPELLELILPYQQQHYLYDVIPAFINKLKTYRIFS